MRYPAINDLLEKIDNKYSLVLIAAKRARQIVDGENVDTEEENKNPVSIAAEEIVEGKLKFKY